jgi:hypothetical protein
LSVYVLDEPATGASTWIIDLGSGAGVEAGLAPLE